MFGVVDSCLRRNDTSYVNSIQVGACTTYTLNYHITRYSYFSINVDNVFENAALFLHYLIFEAMGHL